MGFRLRKSVNFGPVRVNLSKSGVGYSVGGKGFRHTKKANGGTRTTASIPGTGASYVKETGDHRTATESSELDIPQKSFKGLYIFAAVLIVCLAAAFIVFTQREESNPAAGSTGPLASSSSSGSEEADENERLKETVRSLAADSFLPEAITDVRVSDVQAEVFVRSSAVSIEMADMESTAQQASTRIREDLAPRNIVVYIQDDAGSNLLTVINGKTT